jgi:hypothetical protein
MVDVLCDRAMRCVHNFSNTRQISAVAALGEKNYLIRWIGR